MKELSFDDLLDQIEEEQPEEKKTIETARAVADIISEIIKVRTRKNISQRELSKMCGIRQSAIARMERLQAIPRLDTIAKIAACLDIKIGVVEETAKAIETPPILVILPSDRFQYKYDRDNKISFSAYSTVVTA